MFNINSIENPLVSGSKLSYKLALSHLSLNKEKQAKLLINWLDKQPELDSNDLSELMVALCSNLKSLTWYAATAPNLCMETARDFLLNLGASQAEMELLTQAGQQIQPASLGTWLQLTSDGLDGGWYFPHQTTTYHVLNSVADSQDKQLLLQWAETNHVIDCEQIRRSVVQPQPMTELSFLLSEASLKEQIAIARAAFETLEIGWLGTEFETTLQELSAAEIGIVAKFIREGINQLGIIIVEPSTELALTFCYLSDDFDDQKLAMFEGSLGVEGVNFLSVTQNSFGLGVELYYLV